MDGNGEVVYGLNNLAGQNAAAIQSLAVDDRHYAITALTAQIFSLTDVIKNMSMNYVAVAPVQQALPLSCTFCGGEHVYDNCPYNPQSVYFIGNYNWNNNDYSNTYNSEWRQHPNFSWSNQGQEANFPPNQVQQAHPLNYQANPPQEYQASSSTSSMESLLKEYIAKNDAILQSQSTCLSNLEKQVGTLASALKNQSQGVLLSDTEYVRREDKEDCEAITLKSGKQLETLQGQISATKDSLLAQKEEGKEEEQKIASDQNATALLQQTSSTTAGQNATAMLQQASSIDLQFAKLPPPFPQRLQKHTHRQVCMDVRPPDIVKECSVINVVDVIVHQEFTLVSGKDPPMSKYQERRLLQEMVKLKKAMGWPIEKNHGISSPSCLHQILLDEYCNNFVQQQRKLDLAMEEIMKKEVIKWLDVENFYPISNMSGWRACMDYVKNFDEQANRMKRMLQLHELEEFHHLPYKEQTSISLYDWT